MEENGRKSPSERINEMLKFAIGSHLAESKADFATLLDITPETLSRFLSGKREPPATSWKAFNQKLGNVFNDDWLVTGQGEPMSRNLTSSLAQPKPSAIDVLVTELREQRIAKDEQIDRLLTIIENMQKGN